MDDISWRVMMRQALVASGKAIIEVEHALEQSGYSAFVPMQEKFLTFAQSDDDVANFQQFKMERAAEILASAKFPGTLELPGDGYASPYLSSIRRLGAVGLSKTLVGRMAQMNREQALPVAMTAANRARQVIAKEALRFDTGSRMFENYADILEVIRNAAAQNGAVVPKRVARPVDGKVLFAHPHAHDMSIGFTLVKPTATYRDFILLSWRPYLLRRLPEEAVKLTVVKQEDYAQPLLVDFAIIGFSAYERCSTLGEVANGVSAYITASKEIMNKAQVD